MENKNEIMNTVEEVMENNDVMTEVCKTGKNGKLIAAGAALCVTAITGAIVWGVKKLRKRKADKNLVTVEVATEETVTDEEVKG